MHLSDFDFNLPDDRIAQEALSDRAASRMLVVHRREGRWEDRTFRDLPEYLAPGDCLLANDSRVWIPQQNAIGVGLRHLVSPGDARKIMNLLSDGSVDQHPNWKGRFKENSDKMRTGSLYEVAVVLKGLTALSKKKTLSFREKRMLDRAKLLLVSEIAEAEGKPHAAIEERVEKALTKTASPEPMEALAKQKPVAAKRRAANA